MLFSIGTYRPPKSSFGQSMKKPIACKTICSPYHESRCNSCNQLTVGDYYHSIAAGVSYCRHCFQQQLNSLEKKRIVHRTKTAIGYLNKFQVKRTTHDQQTVIENSHQFV